MATIHQAHPRPLCWSEVGLALGTIGIKRRPITIRSFIEYALERHRWLPAFGRNWYTPYTFMHKEFAPVPGTR